MVSGADSSLPATITVLHREFRTQISLRQLAKDLCVTRTSLKRAKNWLIENRHPSFEGYEPESPLTPEQAEAIVTYRSYTTSGIKGDALTARMFPDVATISARKKALRDLFAAHHLTPEVAAKLTHSILEMFSP